MEDRLFARIWENDTRRLIYGLSDGIDLPHALFGRLVRLGHEKDRPMQKAMWWPAPGRLLHCTGSYPPAFLGNVPVEHVL